MMLLVPAKSVNIQLLTICIIEYDDTNIDLGDSRGQY